MTTSQTVKKHPQKTYTCSKPRQNCFGNWIEHCLHYSNSSRQWRHARHHWEILDEEGTLLKSNLSESDISPERLYQYHSRSRFSKADSKRRSKTCLFHWSAENKSWPELLHWSVEDFLTVWMSSTLSGQWLWMPARQCSVTPRKSDVGKGLQSHRADFEYLHKLC